MRSLGLVVAVAVLSTAARADWTPPTAVETAIFVAAEALIVVDVLQTRDFLRHADPTHSYEGNPLLGAHPSDARLFATGAAAMLLTAAGWYFLPTPWRDCITLSAVAVEIPNDIRNATLGARIRF